MTDVVVSADNLGKRYHIGHRRTERYATFRDAIARTLTAPLRRPSGRRQPGGLLPPSVEDFWALRHISFEVQRGDVIGVIGRNGAGKSTLLKLLSRITEPTEGRARIRGRVASLLEVGTGFHPELTGRENVFLNGAILGMSHAEIRRKFDEIVAFAEVERFLDMPVKRYSSGMQVRLAFAVAAHLEPEILVVDEVLAVGDAEFQKKCIGTMRTAATREGRTVFFVSHNLSAVRSLCRRSLVLSDGALRLSGSVDEGLTMYASLRDQVAAKRRKDDTRPCITGVSVSEQQVSSGHLEVRVEFSSPWPLDPALVGVVVFNQLRNPVFGFNTWQDPLFTPRPVKRGVAVLRVPDLGLHSGAYTIDVFLGEKLQNYDVFENAVAFTFMAPEPLPAGLSAESIGAMRVKGRWELSAAD